MTTSLRAFMSAFARQPLLHFLLIGIVIAVLYGRRGERDPDPPDATIRITASDVSRLEAEWQARWKRTGNPRRSRTISKAERSVATSSISLRSKWCARPLPHRC